MARDELGKECKEYNIVFYKYVIWKRKVKERVPPLMSKICKLVTTDLSAYQVLLQALSLCAHSQGGCTATGFAKSEPCLTKLVTFYDGDTMLVYKVIDLDFL